MKAEEEKEKALDLVSWYGKMCRALSQATKAPTSGQSCKKLSGSFAKKPPLFLCLKADGQKPDASMMWTGGDGALLGEYSTLSFGEFPSGAVESRLSQILEVSPPQKYYLSEKACLGILRRAEKRGKQLPELLKQALLDMIEYWQTGGGTVPYTLKVRSGCPGGGKGALVQTDKCATLSTLQDQTLFQPVPMAMQAIGEYKPSNVLSSCKARDYKDATDLVCQAISLDCRNSKVSTVAETLQARTGHTLNAGGVVGQPAYCLQGNGIGRSDNAGCNGAGWNEEVCYTLNTTDRPAVAYEPMCAGFSPQQGSKANGIGWQEECAPTLRSVLCGFPSPAVVHEAQAVFDARGNGDGDIAPTITGDHENRITDYTAVLVKKIIRWLVRRLTPLECERLQGFPDGWTDIGDWVDSKGKKHPASDSPRYKALGNSIALPSWFYVLQKLSLYCGLETTMASLFDGIGGFPLIWESLNGKGSCLWASEIEEFPIAVTSLRFAQN